MELKIVLKKVFPYLTESQLNEIKEVASIKSIPKGTEILREGQYIKVIPIVVDGLIKVYSRHEEKELLLYYIEPFESCIMSFSASLNNDPSRVFAQTEEDSEVILLPVDKVLCWSKEMNDINTLFFNQFNKRYSELLVTIHHVLFNKMDKRLYYYLKEKSEVIGENPLKLTHRQIANELGTAREVISRTIKKLEAEKLIETLGSTIKIIG